MLIPKKSKITVYSYLFKEGVMVARKEYNLNKHADVDVPNLWVLKLMQSLKSRDYVREKFSWMTYYWYLTNDGIEYLREYLNLPREIVPATLKKTRTGGPSRPRFGDRDQGERGGDRERGGERQRSSFPSDIKSLLVLNVTSLPDSIVGKVELLVAAVLAVVEVSVVIVAASVVIVEAVLVVRVADPSQIAVATVVIVEVSVVVGVIVVTVAAVRATGEKEKEVVASVVVVVAAVDSVVAAVIVVVAVLVETVKVLPVKASVAAKPTRSFKGWFVFVCFKGLLDGLCAQK